jgi:hypothetical protein
MSGRVGEAPGPAASRPAAVPTASARPAGPVLVDIRRVTLDGYSAGRRTHFARELATRLAGRGVPEEAARRAAEAICDAAEARLGGTRG